MRATQSLTWMLAINNVLSLVILVKLLLLQ
jgi:hypothetical protein